MTGDNRYYNYVIIMIRTQISLSETEYQWAKRVARNMGISLAELLRRALRSALPVSTSKPWMKYAGLVESGNADSSRQIDQVIYGQKD